MAKRLLSGWYIWRQNHPEFQLLLISLLAWIVIGSSRVPAHRAHGRSGLSKAEMAIEMVAALMLPLAFPLARQVGLSSLWRRRSRAVWEYATGYVLAAAIVELFVIAVGSSMHSTHLAGVGLIARWGTTAAGALAWGWSGRRWAMMRRCGGLPSMRIRGWRADLDCIALGVRTGGMCAVVCSPWMLATETFQGNRAIFVIVAAVLLMERTGSRTLAAMVVSMRNEVLRRAGRDPYATHRAQSKMVPSSIIAR